MSDQLWTQLRDGIQAQLAHSNDEGAARALAIAEAAGLPAAANLATAALGVDLDI